MVAHTRGLRAALGEALPPVQQLLAEMRRLRGQAPPRFMYLGGEGVPKGPVDLLTLRAMLIDGRLDGHTPASPLGSDRWATVAEWLQGAADLPGGSSVARIDPSAGPHKR
jgi:hypothetical protein